MTLTTDLYFIDKKKKRKYCPIYWVQVKFRLYKSPKQKKCYNNRDGQDTNQKFKNF